MINLAVQEGSLITSKGGLETLFDEDADYEFVSYLPFTGNWGVD